MQGLVIVSVSTFANPTKLKNKLASSCQSAHVAHICPGLAQ